MPSVDVQNRPSPDFIVTLETLWLYTLNVAWPPSTYPEDAGLSSFWFPLGYLAEHFRSLSFHPEPP